MATTIKLKNGSGAPTAGDLVQGEPAIDLTNKRLYTEDSGGSVIEVGSNPSSLSIAGTAVTATATELNTLDGITSTTAELNILDGVTSTAAELNILDGVTASTAEINLLDGVTATTAELNILDGVTSTAAELNILDGVTSTTAELNILDGVTATAAELNVLDGVTAFVDEDDMSSDSATSIPSQQSVKAYVDAQVTASDLDFQGDSGGALSIDLDSETLTIAGGTGIDTSGATNTLTVAIDSTVTTLTGTQTLTNKTLTSAVLNTGVSGTAILDEDDMSSDSATQLATQQSIKAYVDAQVAGADTLAELTDTNITTPTDGALLFYDTTTSKWIDNVVSGDITIADTGVAAIGSGVIVNDDINASAAISVSKTALTAGTGLTLTTDTLSVDASQTQITAVGTIGTGTWQGTVITDTYIANDLTISGGTIENTVIGAATPAAGTFTTFTSTGIDDNATSTAITIDSSERTSFSSSSNRPVSVTSTDTNSFVTFQDTNTASLGHVKIGSETNDMVFYANAQERMRIKGGNVGIGTTDPGHLLELNAATCTIAITSSNETTGTSNVFFGDTSDDNIGFIQYTHSNNNLRFGVNASEAMRIDSSGTLLVGGSDVGSGTNQRLVVFSTGNYTTAYDTGGSAIHINNNAATAGSGNFGGGITFGRFGSSSDDISAAIAPVQCSTDEDQMGIAFFYHGSNTRTVALQEGFRLDNSGNVGIGTSDPVNLLHIASSGADFASMRFDASANTTPATFLLRAHDGVFDIRDQENSATRITIDSDGYMGIGNTSPEMRLHVAENNSTITTDVARFSNSQMSNSFNAGAKISIGDDSLAGRQLELSLEGNGGSEFHAYVRTTEAGGALFLGNATNSQAAYLGSDGSFNVGHTGTPLSLISTTTVEGFGIDASETYVAISRSNNASALYLNKPGESTATAGDFIQCRQNGTNIGEISYDGADLAIVQVSDQRLKNNIANSASAGSIIDAMQVRSFDWNDGAHVDYGFVAQELNQAYEPATKVGGDDVDEEPWGIKTQKLIPLLVKEIQDLRARVAQLEGA